MDTVSFGKPTPSGRREAMILTLSRNPIFVLVRLCLKHARLTSQEKEKLRKAAVTGEGLVPSLRLLAQIITFVALALEAKEDVTPVVERWREAAGADLAEEEVAEHEAMAIAS